MRDLEANTVPLITYPIDVYDTGVYWADIDLAGQARRLTLLLDVKLGAGADIDYVIYESDIPFDGADAVTIDSGTLDADGGYGIDFTPTKRYITVQLTVNTDECLISGVGLAYLLRQIPEAKTLVQVM